MALAAPVGRAGCAFGHVRLALDEPLVERSAMWRGGQDEGRAKGLRPAVERDVAMTAVCLDLQFVMWLGF